MGPSRHGREDADRTSRTGYKKGKTVEEVCQEIKKLVYYNVLAPGQKLFYQEVARRVNVSITPVVQALKVVRREELLP